MAWMGAMQAQDFAMARWAVGVRLPGCTDEEVQRALAEARIIRTHLLRPTWHIVSSGDLRWMLALTGPRIKASLRSRHRDLGISAEVIRRSHAVIEKTIRDGKHCTREKIIARLEKARIPTDENRAAHLLLLAELDGLVCSGPTLRGKPTWALLDERVAPGTPWSRDEALEALARRYFTSRCPATLEDFCWWSGLTAADASRAAAMLGGEFRAELFDSRTYLLPKTFAAPKSAEERVYLLPAYDEYTISYRDRSAAVPTTQTSAAVSRNGIFYPLVVKDGRAVGTWKRTRKDGAVEVRVELFGRAEKGLPAKLEKARRHYAGFLQVPVRLAM